MTTTRQLRRERDAAWSEYLAVRKSGKRDRVKLLILIAATRAWHQAQREDRVIAKAKRRQGLLRQERG